jgi:hypothetical protein
MTDALETESVMSVKVIKLPYMLNIETDAYGTKTFNLPYLELVIGNLIESRKNYANEWLPWV